MSTTTKFQPIDLTDERALPEPEPWALKFMEPDGVYVVKLGTDEMTWLDAQLRQHEYGAWAADVDRDHAHAIREQLASATAAADVVLVTNRLYDAIMEALDAQRLAVREMWDVVPYDDASDVVTVRREANRAYDALMDAALLNAAGLEAA